MLQPGDSFPHLSFTAVDGQLIRYDDLWQRRFLVLVALRDADAPEARAYTAALRAEPALVDYDTSLVVYDARRQGFDSAAGPAHPSLVPPPSVTIVDRWGEVQHVASSESERGLPSPAALVEWLRYVQMQCPECQGEAR
jgi:hypothetical protein